MADRQSKFDVREHGTLAELKNTFKFAVFVLITFLTWLSYGGLVRRAYKKAEKQGRAYHVDCMPSGKKPQ